MFTLKMDQHFADILKDSDLVGVAHSHQHHGDGDKDTERDGKGSPNAPDTRTHGHDRLGARSVGVELTDGPIDWVKFKQWLKDFLEEEKERIWRLKGVLWTIASGATTPWGTGAGSRTVVQVRSKGLGLCYETYAMGSLQGAALCCTVAVTTRRLAPEAIQLLMT